jgi:hypothetical protein
MNTYIGCKIIKAAPKTYGEYKKEKYGDKANFESNISDSAEGYKVCYPAIGENTKEHISWSPKDIFERAYRKVYVEELSYITGYKDSLES